MMADISHWFVRRRGLAVVVVASGNYFAGTIWPFLMSLTMPLIGWRATYVGIGVIVAAAVPPLALMMSRRPSAAVFDEAEAATQAARADVGISPRLLLALLVLAGFSCCVAMSMPQVHLVAYCGDLGYGVARGAQMLSAMMALGIVSRIGSGFVADSIGGTATLMIGSFMQGLALLLYLFFNGLESLFVVSGIFGLFQGGIVPMYAVICRELLAPRRAGAAIGLVVSATILGMAFGGYISGVIFDLTSSYRMAFLNGLMFNVFNFAIVAWLFWRRRQRQPAGALAPRRVARGSGDARLGSSPHCQLGLQPHHLAGPIFCRARRARSASFWRRAKRPRELRRNVEGIGAASRRPYPSKAHSRRSRWQATLALTG